MNALHGGHVNVWKKKTRRQLHKNDATSIEQVLEATPHKTIAIRPPTCHHEKSKSSTNQTGRTLLEQEGRTYKRCIPEDPFRWASKGRKTVLIYIQSSVLMKDIASKTSQEQWKRWMGGESGSERSVLEAQRDDDDDDDDIRRKTKF